MDSGDLNRGIEALRPGTCSGNRSPERPPGAPRFRPRVPQQLHNHSDAGHRRVCVRSLPNKLVARKQNHRRTSWWTHDPGVAAKAATGPCQPCLCQSQTGASLKNPCRRSRRRGLTPSPPQLVGADFSGHDLGSSSCGRASGARSLETQLRFAAAPRLTREAAGSLPLRHGSSPCQTGRFGILATANNDGKGILANFPFARNPTRQSPPRPPLTTPGVQWDPVLRPTAPASAHSARGAPTSHRNDRHRTRRAASFAPPSPWPRIALFPVA